MLQRTLTTPIYCATIGIEKVRCDITEEVHIMATIQKRGDSYSISHFTEDRRQGIYGEVYQV